MTDPTQTPAGAPVPTTDPLAQATVQTIEDIIDDAKDSAEGAIIAASPVMATPVLKQLWEGVFTIVINTLMVPLATLGGRVVVSLQEYKALKNAVAAQAALDAAKKTGDPNAVTQASQNVDQAILGAIQYVGGVKP